ncbi:hypothetical protein [Thermotoga sp. SG1]|uniref:hypothetical protein n=1 Tax=Thermotoga sp. SG1 TaxID=126739 RepID=UPI000C78F7FC|nr:hypothetical protein [Thermotoga sp. SG1]PLV56300.1 hypothetical protein AS006_07005 [Thermotoga sp. SG1]
MTIVLLDFDLNIEDFLQKICSEAKVLFVIDENLIKIYAEYVGESGWLGEMVIEELFQAIRKKLEEDRMCLMKRLEKLRERCGYTMKKKNGHLREILENILREGSEIIRVVLKKEGLMHFIAKPVLQSLKKRHRRIEIVEL